MIKIVDKNREFYSKTEIIGSNEIIMFSYTEGTDSIEFEKEDAYELRGLTFVNGRPFPMLKKFFNIGESKPLSYYEDLEIESIQVKDDGSLIGFLVLDNGDVIAKTQMGLKNSQTYFANSWLNSNNNKEKISNLYAKDIIPLFEYVGPRNKIVIEYDSEELILIQVRTIDFQTLKSNEVKQISFDNYFEFKNKLTFNFNEILNLQKNEDSIEGLIIRFTNGDFVKAKTAWYFLQHKTSIIKDRSNEILDFLFDNETIELTDYESVFFEKIRFITQVVSSRSEFKGLMFKKEDPNRIRYIIAFNAFKLDYLKHNDIDTDIGLFHSIVTNTLDDFEMDLDKRASLNIIGNRLLLDIIYHVNHIKAQFNLCDNKKDLATNNSDYLLFGLLFKLNNKSTNVEIRNSVIKQFEKLIIKKEMFLYS